MGGAVAATAGGAVAATAAGPAMSPLAACTCCSRRCRRSCCARAARTLCTSAGGPLNSTSWASRRYEAFRKGDACQSRPKCCRQYARTCFDAGITAGDGEGRDNLLAIKHDHTHRGWSRAIAGAASAGASERPACSLARQSRQAGKQGRPVGGEEDGLPHRRREAAAHAAARANQEYDEDHFALAFRGLRPRRSRAPCRRSGSRGATP